MNIFKKNKNNINKNKIELITSNTKDNIFLSYCAAKCCYGGQIDINDIEKQSLFIKNKMMLGHESIIEHTNLVFVFTVPYKYINDITTVISKCQYLYTNIIFNKKYCHILIGGSIRGYKNLISNILDQTNYLLKMIKNALYKNSDYVFYQDLIEYGIMNDGLFRPISYDKCQDKYIEIPLSDNIYIESYDDPILIYNKIKKYGFTEKDVLNVCKITVKFKDITRTCTAQLNRHRNAISQQSQRYINFSDKGFVSIHEFKDKYYVNSNDNTKLKTNYYVPDNGWQYNLDDISKLYISYYNSLIEQGVDKEDARNFLPGNINTTEYVTFTALSLLKFIELRDDNAAQNEIHKYASVLKEFFKDNFKSIINVEDEHIYDFLLPSYIIAEEDSDINFNNIDEILEETIDEI